MKNQTLSMNFNFTLCYECAINKLENCTHSDSSRAIEGTWVTEEIKVALIEGYKIVEIYSIWHWENSTFDLFSGHVDTFLKSKTVDEHIVEFISAGPKNYGYMTNKDKKVTKIKGFHINCNCDRAIEQR